MIQGVFFNMLYFMLALMHRIWAKVQGLRTFRKHKSIDQRFQNHMRVGRSNSHQFGMPRSWLSINALRVHHSSDRKVKLADHRSAHFRFEALTRSVSWSQAPGWRSKVQVKSSKKVYGELRVDHDLHRYDVMIGLNDRKEVLLRIGR